MSQTLKVGSKTVTRDRCVWCGEGQKLASGGMTLAEKVSSGAMTLAEKVSEV